MCCFALMLYFQNFLAPPLSISISQGQYQSVRVSIGQLGLILVSRGQYWSVEVKIGQLGSKLVSWGQNWSVGVNIGQLASILVSWGQYQSGTVNIGQVQSSIEKHFWKITKQIILVIKNGVLVFVKTNYFKCSHFSRSQIKVYQISKTYSDTITNR